MLPFSSVFFIQAEDVIRDLVRSRGLGDVYKRQILPGLLGSGEVDLAYLRDVYPFHPALIETLIDVTALMQRERSALRLLYELLVIHYPTLPLGPVSYTHLTLPTIYSV